MALMMTGASLLFRNLTSGLAGAKVPDLAAVLASLEQEETT